MDITEVPFNKFLGVERASDDPGCLLRLGESPSFQNHLGTVHAGVQLALAEATSGECILRRFPDFAAGVLAVVRRVEAKFKNPLNGTIRSRATISQEGADRLVESLRTKGRGFISVDVEVVGAGGVVGLASTVEWFVQKQQTGTS
jgi:acyl-coenzyme A thioesterase PaaI-like protein